MKNLIIKKGLCLLLVALGLVACDEDIHNFTKETGSEATNAVYIADSIFTYSLFRDLEGEYTGVDTIIAKFPVCLTEPEENDVIVTLEVESMALENGMPRRAMVEAYNQRYGTNYTYISYADLGTSNMTVTIPAGQTQSDSTVTIAYAKPMNNLNRIGGYLIPVRILSYKGTDTKIDYDERHAYLVIDVTQENEVYFDSEETSASMNAIEQGLNTVSFALKPHYVIQGQEDAKVQVSVNNDLIAAFNAEQGTDYQPIPSGLTASYEVTMSKGSADAASFTLEYTGDISALDKSKDYIIPLEITSVSGDAIKVLESDKVFYLIVSVFAAPDPTTSSLVTSEAEIGGTVVADKSKFTADWLYADGSPIAYFGVGNEDSFLTGGMSVLMPLEKELDITIDLGVEYKNITGLQLVNTNPDGRDTNVSTLDVSYVNEKMQEMSMEAVSAGSIEAPEMSKNLYIKFEQPVTARYIKLNNIFNNNPAQLWLNNFNIFTQP